ncbi:MAG TPA: glycosyltransferase [Solirubrobacteraceae bacterium]|jgi:glycosyltransferase involved in cell wall biosynthesis
MNVSVVIPAYNYAHYLPEAIDTALAQDHDGALEVIVVDDGSTDDTPAVLAGYGDRIHAIRRPNGGLNAATSTGIDAATGELITFLDADDTWPRDRVRKLAAALAAHPEAALAWGDMEVVDDTGATLAPSFRAACGIVPYGGRVFGRLLRNNFISAGSLMIRAGLRGLYCPIREDAPYQDWWMALQVSRVAEVVAIGDVVNRYRHHGANMNLGSDARGAARLAASELRFRRWTLQTAGDLATPLELLLAVEALDDFTERGASVLRRSRRDALGIAAEDRALAVQALERASAALDDGEPEAAFAAIVAAIGHDPLYDQPRELLGLLAGHVVEAVAA